MTTTSSIAELQSAGVKLEAAEAVAITQQLIQSLRGASVRPGLEPPYGPPTAATVVLGTDGSVTCAGCGSTPAISEIAIFLDSLLPSCTPRVPGALRYTIARALLEVDVAPFDSLDAFSEALARNERGDRADVVRRLVERSEAPCAIAAVMMADRRRPRATATDLRRALREADARLYVQQLRTPAPPPPRPSSTRNMPAIAACLGAGMMLIAAGEVMQRGEMPKVAAAPIVAPAVLPATTVPLPELTEQSATSLVGTLPPPKAASAAPEATRPAPRARGTTRDRSESPSTTRTTRTTAKIKKAGTRPGVLDRLKLQWLRKAFVLRADEL